MIDARPKMGVKLKVYAISSATVCSMYVLLCKVCEVFDSCSLASAFNNVGGYKYLLSSNKIPKSLVLTQMISSMLSTYSQAILYLAPAWHQAYDYWQSSGETLFCRNERVTTQAREA